jgi:hypothetical protein
MCSFRQWQEGKIPTDWLRQSRRQLRKNGGDQSRADSLCSRVSSGVLRRRVAVTTGALEGKSHRRSIVRTYRVVMAASPLSIDTIVQWRVSFFFDGMTFS